MGKAAGATVISILLGGGVMAVLGEILGVRAEPAALTLVGVGLWASSQILSPPKLPAQRKLATKSTGAQGA